MPLPIVVFLLIVFHLFIPTQSFGTIFGNKTIECDFGGKKETRHVMDCNQDVEYQARAFFFKVDVLDKIKLEGSTEKKVLREVGQVLQILKLQNQQLCQRWNACAINIEDFNRQSDWLMEVFTSFSMILENVKLSEMDDPALQKDFLREVLDWFKNTAEHAKNKRIHKIWDSIKNELDTLKEEVKVKAREGAKEGAAEAIAEFEKQFMHMLEGKLSPPIPNEKIQQEIDSLKASVEKERLEKASILVERGVERLEGEKYEKAFIDFEEALKILPDGSEASLSTHFNLAIALIDCPTGDREANLKNAIISYNKILPFYLKVNNLAYYASTLNNLGLIYCRLSEVRDKENNLELAIEAFHEALKIYTFENSLQGYASVQMNLGVAYWRLSEARNMEVNLGLAIQAYREALRVYIYDKFPQDYAKTQINLANAYSGLSKIRDKEKYLELAMQAYHEALNVFTFENSPQGYALTQLNLGVAYFLLSEVRNTEVNLELAVWAYQHALIIRTFEKFPEEYALTQMNLGVSFRRLSQVKDKEANLELAIKAHKEALKVYIYEKFPYWYAKTQMNLGVAYWSLSEVRDKEVNLGLAFKAYQEALKVYTLEKFPQDYAVTQMNLSIAYCGLSEARDKEANLWFAIQACKEALKIFTSESFQFYFIEASSILAKALSSAGDFKRAIEVMDEMLPVAEKINHPKAEQYRQFYASLKSSK